MTSASFSRPGAVDLSGLKQQAQGAGGSGPSSGQAGPSYVTQLSSVPDFETAIRQSMTHPVIVEFTSARAQGAQALSNDLAEIVNGMSGRALLARVDVDAHPEIAQALQIQGVPTVIALLGGQAAPLFQGIQPRANLVAVFDQVIQAAVANGIVGKAEPVTTGTPADGADPAAHLSDPRFDPAYAAMEAGDFENARAEFDKLLAQSPNDTEALTGRAQAGLLARSAKLDGSELIRVASAPSDVDAQLAAADFELVQGDPDASFGRLVELVRSTSGDDRERVRLRLLELFESLGNADPAVLKFRRRLATALF